MTVDEKLYKLRSMQCELQDKYCLQCKETLCAFCKEELENETTKWLGNYCPYKCEHCGRYVDSKERYCPNCGRKAVNYD
jgi:hypothetical protein